MLCDHLEGWDGEGAREGDARGKRMDLRTRGVGRVSWDKVTEWHGHIYIYYLI